MPVVGSVTKLTSGSGRCASAGAVTDCMTISYIASNVDNPGGYLNRSVINGCRDATRQSSSRRSLVRALRPIENDEPEFQVLDDAIAGLPFNQRAAIVLRFYGGWTAEKIAHALDCSPNSIGPWMNRALDTLRKDLA